MTPTRKPLPAGKVIMIDNYDSFTFNLVQYLQELQADVLTIRNDAYSSNSILASKPRAVILSPGPSDPDHAGVCLGLVAACAERKVPLLGVCLGHQTIGQAFGGKVVRATLPKHGKVSLIQHQSQGVFRNLPTPFKATRYHSLIVDEATLPSALEITARAEDGLIMGLRHRQYPIEGVQFHPESVLTEHGHSMLRNFLEGL